MPERSMAGSETGRHSGCLYRAGRSIPRTGCHTVAGIKGLRWLEVVSTQGMSFRAPLKDPLLSLSWDVKERRAQSHFSLKDRVLNYFCFLSYQTGGHLILFYQTSVGLPCSFCFPSLHPKATRYSFNVKTTVQRFF